MPDVMYFTSLYFLPLVALLYTVKLMQYLLERFFNSLILCSVAHAWQSTTTPWCVMIKRFCVLLLNPIGIDYESEPNN